MKTYKEFNIYTVPFDVENVSGMLWQLDLDGINEFDNYLKVFASEDKNISRKDIVSVLENLVEIKIIESFTIEESSVEDKNWNEEYEKNVRVIEVTDRVVIKPSFKDYISKPGQIIITIDPKMSFGTGEHATTKLVMRFIEKYSKGGEKVLDIGSGTGVLAISAVLLGAKSAICVDNDEWCELNGKENVKTNNLENKIEVKLGTIKDIQEKDFDLILANINKHILIDVVKEIRSKIKETGTLILSGLLNTDEADIVKIYSGFGFRLKEKSTMDEWISLVFRID